MGPERRLETWAIKYARDRGAWLLKFVSPGRRGLPDRILIKPGAKEVLFVEFKSPKGKMTALQQIWKDRIGTNVVRSKDEFTTLFKDD